MTKIYTFTPNPALDLAGHVRALRSNEKNYVFRERRDPGGNGVNVARVATRLGAQVTALGFLGGPTGQQIAAMLSAEGVRHDFTRIRATTRTNVTVTNDADHKQTRLTFPGPKVTRAELAALKRRIGRLRPPALLVMGGSLPHGCPDSIYSMVGGLAQGQGIPVILDAPVSVLRASLGGKFRPLLIKPNIAELEELTRRKLGSEAAILRAARALARKADLICVSLGAGGAYLVAGRKAWRGISPGVKARGTVGAGDSMVGALAFRLAQPGNSSLAEAQLLDAFAWGLAAGAASAEAEGTAMAGKKRIATLCAQVKIEALK